MAPMYRAQILLEPAQHQELERLARETGRSTSDLVREIVGGYLAQRSSAESRRLAADALEWLAASRREIENQGGIVPETLLKDMREERNAQLDTPAGALQ
jgi:predicted DNA-binding protein